jgi:hypothetical protein
MLNHAVNLHREKSCSLLGWLWRLLQDKHHALASHFFMRQFLPLLPSALA